MRVVFIITALLFLTAVGHAATYYVPDQYGTIQEAINALSNGDTVIVRSGIYYERINFNAKGITLKSEFGASVTVIDGCRAGTVVTCNFYNAGHSYNAHLEGFTICNGSAYDGGGMYIRDTESATIVKNCVFHGNLATHGGGMTVKNCDLTNSPKIIQCTFYNNAASDRGGAVHVNSSASYKSWPKFINCTLWGNTAATGGALYQETWSNASFRNSIVWNNTPDGMNTTAASYCCHQDNISGGNNICTDPLLVNPDNQDFHLTEDSPCIDAAYNGAQYIPSHDFEGDVRIMDGDGDGMATVDMGIDESPSLYNEVWIDDNWVGSYHGEEVAPGLFFGYNAFAAIQDGIDEVVAPGTINVADGNYRGARNRDLVFDGRVLTVRSANGPDECVIDCENSGRGFYFDQGESADCRVEGVTIRNGWADIGGGMCCLASSPTIVRCIFQGNSSDYGGGIYCSVSSITLTECTFVDNSSVYYGGGICSCSCSATITDCIFERNRSDNWGGGFHNSGYSTPTIRNCIFLENDANWGGGMHNLDSTPDIGQCVFQFNSAGFQGGGMQNAGSSPTVVNCTFLGNAAPNYGGGMDNDASSLPTVTSCIFWGNAPDEIAGSATVTYSCIQGGFAGTGNIDDDPLLADAGSGDVHLTWGSPCIGAGHNLTVTDPADFEGDPRIAFGKVDIGADEYYYHLYHEGDVVPGSSIDLKVIGYPGAAVTLYVGSGIADPPHSTEHGEFFLEWPAQWQGKIGTVPGSGILVFTATVPATWSSGSEKPIQALVGPWGGSFTLFTNLDMLVVE